MARGLDGEDTSHHHTLGDKRRAQGGDYPTSARELSEASSTLISINLVNLLRSAENPNR